MLWGWGWGEEMQGLARDERPLLDAERRAAGWTESGEGSRSKNNEEQKLTEREKGKQTEKDKQGIRRKKKIDVG